MKAIKKLSPPEHIVINQKTELLSAILLLNRRAGRELERVLLQLFPNCNENRANFNEDGE